MSRRAPSVRTVHGFDISGDIVSPQNVSSAQSVQRKVVVSSLIILLKGWPSRHRRLTRREHF